MKENRVRISPILEIKNHKKKTAKIIHWFAERRQLGPDYRLNLARRHWHCTGKTALEALQNLKAKLDSQPCSDLWRPSDEWERDNMVSDEGGIGYRYGRRG